MFYLNQPVNIFEQTTEQRSQYSDYATGWRVRESNPGGEDIFRTRPARALGPNQPPVK